MRWACRKARLTVTVAGRLGPLQVLLSSREDASQRKASQERLAAGAWREWGETSGHLSHRLAARTASAISVRASGANDNIRHHRSRCS